MKRSDWRAPVSQLLRYGLQNGLLSYLAEMGNQGRSQVAEVGSGDRLMMAKGDRIVRKSRIEICERTSDFS